MDLHSASDYDNIGQSLVATDTPIEGRIVPTEDASGQRLALRREDFAFITEGLCERGAGFPWANPHIVSHTVPEAFGTAIKVLYSSMSGSVGYRFIDPSYAWSRMIFDSVPDIRGILPAWLRENSCHIPNAMPQNEDGEYILSANYMRRLFYYLELCHRNVAASDSSYCTRAGSVNATQNEADNHDAMSMHTYNHTCSGSVIENNDPDGGGYVFNDSKGGHWSLAGTGVGGLYFYGNSLAWYEDQTGHKYDRYERWYAGGALCVSRQIQQADHSTSNHQAIVVFMVVNNHVTGSSGQTTTTTKYVLIPWGRVDKVYSSDGYAEYYAVRGGLQLNDYRNIVSSAFPGASFSLGTAGNDNYSVYLSSCYILADRSYKSRINDVGWNYAPGV